MRRNGKLVAALAAGSAITALFAAGTAQAADPAQGLGRLGLCIGDSPGTTDQILAEGATYIKPCTLTVAPGKSASCQAYDVAPGQYWITGGKYPQVPCDPPEHRGAIGGNTCLGKVHHFHVTHRPFGNGS